MRRPWQRIALTLSATLLLAAVDPPTPQAESIGEFSTEVVLDSCVVNGKAEEISVEWMTVVWTVEENTIVYTPVIPLIRHTGPCSILPPNMVELREHMEIATIERGYELGFADPEDQVSFHY